MLAREKLESVIALTRETPRGFRPMALATLGGIYLDDSRPLDALALGDECVHIVASLLRGRALAALSRFGEARAAFGEAIATGSNKTFEHFVVDDEIAAWKAHNEIGGTLVSEERFAPAEPNGVNRGLAWWADGDDRRIRQRLDRCVCEQIDAGRQLVAQHGVPEVAAIDR